MQLVEDPRSRTASTSKTLNADYGTPSEPARWVPRTLFGSYWLALKLGGPKPAPRSRHEVLRTCVLYIPRKYQARKGNGLVCDLH